jgi:hypothetical protein
VGIARDPVAFGGYCRFAALCGEPAELNHQHRLIGERLRELHLFVTEGALVGKSQADSPLESPAYGHRHEHHGNDPEFGWCSQS